MWQSVIIDNVVDLLKMVLPAPIFGYLFVDLLERMVKAWKLENKRKKWLLCSAMCIFTLIFFRYIGFLVSV